MFRLYKCSNEPRSFFDRIFGGISFSSSKACDKRDDDSVLYLYDEYKLFLDEELGTSIMEKTININIC